MEALRAERATSRGRGCSARGTAVSRARRPASRSATAPSADDRRQAAGRLASAARAARNRAAAPSAHAAACGSRWVGGGQARTASFLNRDSAIWRAGEASPWRLFSERFLCRGPCERLVSTPVATSCTARPTLRGHTDARGRRRVRPDPNLVTGAHQEEGADRDQPAERYLAPRPLRLDARARNDAEVSNRADANASPNATADASANINAHARATALASGLPAAARARPQLPPTANTAAASLAGHTVTSIASSCWPPPRRTPRSGMTSS